jgi:hypothetical protein
MSIQTNFRAEDMLGTPEAAAVAAPKTAPKVARYVAPKPEPVAVVEEAPVIEEAVETPVAE